MTTATYSSPFWAHSDAAMVGVGDVVRIDPGTGPGRYQRALDALRSSGREVGMASFTFDPDEPGSIVEIPEAVESAPLSARPTPESTVTVLNDGEDEWRSGLQRALNAIDSGIVEKVVLTRQVDLRLTEEAPLEAVIERLRTGEIDSYTFHVAGLVGASPELLVSLRGSRVSSLALAGTASDAERLATDKMDREHTLARTSVAIGMSPHVEGLEIQERTVRGFGEIKHLATEFEGRAAPGVTVQDLLTSLHPTAAVAGTPTDRALKVIKDLEPRSRGRYAGPVGWFNVSGEGEFAIALRCGMVSGKRVTLYAGGGIVRGSDLEGEWRETELKLQPMRRALGLGSSGA